MLTLRGRESEGYGAYTYVIFPLRGRETPEARALLAAIVESTEVADPQEPIEVRRVTNLFVIPGKRATPIAVQDAPDYARDISNYDWSRAQSLVSIATDGVLARGGVPTRFRRSPGPFLLTLPVPIEQARGTDKLLLADLNGYPAAGFADLVTSYKNDLVDAFPTNQRVWRPPWRMQAALTLVRIGLLTGVQNIAMASSTGPPISSTRPTRPCVNSTFTSCSTRWSRSLTLSKSRWRRRSRGRERPRAQS